MYDRVDQQMKKLLDASRLHEWQNFLKLDAARVTDKSKAMEIISHGAEVLPAQWIEVDKNEALRASGKTMEPKMKSRLVARGDLSALFNRSDSPTADKEAVFRVICYVKRAEDMIGISRPWILPGREAQPTVVVTTAERRSARRLDKARRHVVGTGANIYGTRDAGRGLWRRIRKVLLSNGMNGGCCVWGFVLLHHERNRYDLVGHPRRR